MIPLLHCENWGKRHRGHEYWHYDIDKNEHELVYCDGKASYE